MLDERQLQQGGTFIIESDRCSSQYKCAEHFYSLSQIATQFNVTII